MIEGKITDIYVYTKEIEFFVETEHEKDIYVVFNKNVFKRIVKEIDSYDNELIWDKFKLYVRNNIKVDISGWNRLKPQFISILENIKSLK